MKMKTNPMLVLTVFILSAWFCLNPAPSLAQSRPSTTQDAKATATNPLMPPSRVQLKDCVPETKRSLRWSPKGAKIALRPDSASLRGELKLAKILPTLHLRLFRSSIDAHFDRLWLDSNGDQEEQESEIHVLTVKERRKKIWSNLSSYELNFEVKQADQSTTKRRYPMSFWFVSDPAEPTARPVLRWSRRGWHQGRFRLDDTWAYFYITDRHMDGIFDSRDAWVISASEEGLFTSPTSRGFDDHAWFKERAFRVSVLSPHGMQVVIKEIRPKLSREDEEKSRDAFAADKRAKRAKKPLAFSHAYEESLALSKKDGRPLFLDFETTWCGPCKAMDRMVYTAAAVVEKAQSLNIIALKIDGDERRDLTKTYRVKAYPTLIILDKMGKERARAVGYQSIREVLKMFKTLEKATK